MLDDLFEMPDNTAQLLEVVRDTTGLIAELRPTSAKKTDYADGALVGANAGYRKGFADAAHAIAKARASEPQLHHVLAYGFECGRNFERDHPGEASPALVAKALRDATGIDAD